MLEEAKIILFGPKTGKSLIRLYPELAQDPKLKILPMDDLVFAWYIGCESSPIDPEWTDVIRYKSAALNAIKDENKRRLYGDGVIPEKVKEGIESFKKFKVDLRMKAKRILQKTMYDYEQFGNVDVKKDFFVTKIDKEGNVTEEMDWGARKQYIDGTAVIMKNMPTLIEQLEQGFGIEEKEKESGRKMIDKFHNEKRES